MKVTGIETLRCDAGWRMFSFFKVMTDDGLIGWSEYNESFGSHGLSGVIEALSPAGWDLKVNEAAVRARPAELVERICGGNPQFGQASQAGVS